MSDNRPTRRIVLFIFGFVLFNYPFLWLAGVEETGSPQAYYVAFSLWFLFIVFIWLAVEFGVPKNGKS